MKKVLFLVVIAAGMLMSVHAEFQYGVKFAGALTSGKDIMINDIYPTIYPPIFGAPGAKAISFWDQFMKDSLSFAGGFTATYPINEWFSMQGEILYAPKRIHCEADSDFHDPSTGNLVQTFSDHFELKVDYIDIPVLAKFNASADLSVLGGVSMSIAVAHHFSREMAMTSYDPDGEIVDWQQIGDYSGEIDDQVNTVSFNLHLGTQYYIFNNIYVEFRYVHSLSPMEKFAAVSDEERASLGGMSSEDVMVWALSHPFAYYETQNPEQKDAGSIKTDALYLFTGYTF